MKQAIHSKAKGNRGELELAKILTNRFGMPFARVGASSGARPKTTNLTDTAKSVMTGDIVCPDNFIYSVEVKNVAASKGWWWFDDIGMFDKFLDQASSDAQSIGKEPLLCVKVPQRGWIAAVQQIDFIEKFKESHKVIYREWTVIKLEDLLALSDTLFFRTV